MVGDRTPASRTPSGRSNHYATRRRWELTKRFPQTYAFLTDDLVKKILYIHVPPIVGTAWYLDYVQTRHGSVLGHINQAPQHAEGRETLTQSAHLVKQNCFSIYHISTATDVSLICHNPRCLFYSKCILTEGILYDTCTQHISIWSKIKSSFIG